MLRVRLLVILAIASLPATALAHLTVDYPVARYPAAEQKSEPCGRAGGTRSQNVTTFAPGETIAIELRETINHPSHFRVSFDDDGDDDFCYPASTTDFYTCPSVILDNIADDPAAAQTIEFTFPDIECDNCTLQVVQVMYDKATIWGDNDLYFNCSDIVLAAGGAPDAGPNNGTPDASVPGGPDSGGGGGGGNDLGGDGCSAGGGASGAGGALVLALLFVCRRRRRSIA
jgi:uncharacterized membrane protein YgcG